MFHDIERGDEDHAAERLGLLGCRGRIIHRHVGHPVRRHPLLLLLGLQVAHAGHVLLPELRDRVGHVGPGRVFLVAPTEKFAVKL
ncbi:MAG: hypothetical protein FD129_3259, partial [bacterium]